MHISEYNYEFPQEAIAMFPPEERGSTKLFVVDTQKATIAISRYDELDQFFDTNWHLVRNVTKVFHARLFGVPQYSDGSARETVEIFITEPRAQSLDEYIARQWSEEFQGFELEFLSTLKRNQLSQLVSIQGDDDFEWVNVRKIDDAFRAILRKRSSKITAQDIFELLEQKGKVPLPPYIKRDTITADDARYQTIFAKKTGSVAAPTASLNFTKALEKRLQNKKVTIDEIILHVGRGTFMPLRDETIEKNVLHHEPIYIPTETLQSLYEAKTRGQRVVAIGTTVTRTLETVAQQIMTKQVQPILDETNLFIYPPYEFKIIDGLLTNFHFPKSSLITLVDAFLRHKNSKLSWREIYEFGIKNDAKLFSYGDSMLII